MWSVIRVDRAVNARARAVRTDRRLNAARVMLPDRLSGVQVQSTDTASYR